MAGKGAVLAIRIVSDASGAKKGFTEAESQVARFQGGLDRTSVAAGGVLAGVVAIADKAKDAASALQQSGGAIETVYGAQAKAVDALADKAAVAMGLSERAYKEGAALMGAQLKGLGFSVDEAVAKQDGLQQRAADLAATFGGSTADAVAALSSALKGERDPIERYGVQLNQAAVDAKVAALGMDTSTAAAEKHAQAVATLALIQDQTAASAGAFNRELDTAAGASAVAAASFEDAQAALGEVLLPVVTAGAQQLAGLAGWMVANKNVIVPLVAVIGGLAAGVLAVNAAFRVYTAVTRVAAAVQWIFNAAMAANPLGLIIIGIVAVVAAVVLMYNKFEWFRTIVQGIAKAVMTYIGWWVDGIKWVIDKLSWVKDAASGIGDLFGGSATVAVTPVAGGSLSGTFGAAAGPAPATYAPLYGAPLSALAGGGSTAGQGSHGTTTVNVTITDAIDPISTGRTLEKVLRQYAQATGSTVQLTVGGRR